MAVQIVVNGLKIFMCGNLSLKTKFTLINFADNLLFSKKLLDIRISQKTISKFFLDIVRFDKRFLEYETDYSLAIVKAI